MMQFAFKMTRHQKEAQEFLNALKAIEPIMTSVKETRESKRSTFNMMANELSDNTFNLRPVAEQIMTIINMKKDVCMEYPDAETQVNGILSWIPRMAKYRGMLLGQVKKNRKEFGLKI